MRAIADFVSLFQYTQWANERVLHALETHARPPERALDLFSHLLRAQDVWYGRVRNTHHAGLELWHRDELSACAERMEASTRRWEEVLASCSPDDLDRGVEYTNSSGTSFDTPLREILSHVVNHGTHHRAQIALLLRQADIAPPPTDYIFFVRQR